ncbi:cysteine hydrolase family protein [Pseudosulfitobacter sp. DSM 107133]|uniref:cysteine hydrolase family protein n=1 Tax=Pseudosulfitobacter sp. DSM 107133 TaxID=2883100 RepID=UPI000DF4917E|nr:cysteine hydrolase family protein [Pseudosulfitobacter sp. DSM 107133]UOA26004.1 Streptothricin hydrolase [Pseudosulfitobacter sp. DSM 107133]
MNTVTALVLVDIQNDYFDGGLWPLHDMDAAAEVAASVLAHARSRGWPVFHVFHHGAETAPFFRPDTAGAEIHPSVTPIAGEAMILKHRPNSFLNTDLHRLLQTKGVTHLRLIGAMSQMCIDATARAARDLGYTVEIIAEACASRAINWNGTEVPAPLVHAAFMAALDGTYATVYPTLDDAA